MIGASPHASRRPPFGLGIAAVGFGLALWYGWDWAHLPRWTEADIEQSVELNLQLDLQRHALPAEAISEKRAQVRSELKAEIDRERETAGGAAAAGLIVGLLGLAQMLLVRARQPRPGQEQIRKS